jgi:hypothetical protein
MLVLPLLVISTLVIAVYSVDIVGKVLSHTLNPLPNVRLLLNTDAYAITKIDGQFTFYNVTQGRYYTV